MRPVESLLPTWALIGAIACSGGEEPQADTGECFDYSNWDGTAPKVSLRSRLLNDDAGADGGLLRRACAASTCHGSETSPDGELYLGPPLMVRSQPRAISEQELLNVLANLVQAPSATNDNVMRVAPFEPQNSFLMHKLDGCYQGISAGCSPLAGHSSDNPCGDRMPQGNPPLSDAERDEVRRWIAQGALDD